MTKHPAIALAVQLAVVGVLATMPRHASAINNVTFGTADVGVSKSIAQWGKEVNWASYDNMRLTLDNMGASNLSFVPTNFYIDQPLQADGTLNAAARSKIDEQVAVGQMARTNMKFELGGDNGISSPDVSAYVKTLVATKKYIESKGATVSGVMPFNEPDYWPGSGTMAQLHDILAAVKADPNLQGLDRIGASTLSSGSATAWWDAIKDVATHGSTHALSSPPYTTGANYANFFTHVAQTGGTPYATELHGLGEAMIAADRGVQKASWWGSVLRARGTFVKASQGTRLAYSENLANQTAFAIYRAPDGTTKAFGGGFERAGQATSYKFSATDKDMFVNGVGPLRDYTMNVGQASEAWADIQYGAYGNNVQPALDGAQWKIVNSLTGQVMEVTGGATADGSAVRTAADIGAASQRWNIVRTPDGYLQIFNANSGRTLDVLGAPLDGGVIDTYGHADNLIQQWYMEPAGAGAYYLRNGNSSQYLTGSAGQNTQSALIGSKSQAWKFVLSNRTSPATHRYQFQGSANDSIGTSNASTTGTISYGIGPTSGSAAINFDGSTAFATLPAGVANATDMTISTSVKWNGGGNWQRIFDFGTGTSKYMYLTPASGDGTMRFAMTSTGNTGEQILDTSALPTGQWVNLTLTLGGNSAVLYVNGKPQAAAQMTLNPSDIASTLNYLGKSQFNDPLLNGSLSDFKVYDYALVPTQVMDLITRNVTWVGGQNGNTWDTATTSNFKLAATNAATGFAYADTVSFDGSGATNIVISGSVTPRALNVSGAADQTFSGTGSITGPGSLTKSGTGALILANTGTNDFWGTATVSGGTLQIGNGGSNGSAGVGDLVDNGTLVFNRLGTLTQGVGFGTISGTGAVTIAHGTVVMNAVNRYSGVTTISGGATLQLGDGANDGAILGSAGTINNGTLTYNNVTADVFTDANGVSGAGAIIKNGAGTQVLGGDNSYGGGTTLNAGALVAGNANALGTGTLRLRGGNIGSTGTFSLANPIDVGIATTSKIGYAGQTGNLTLSGPLMGSGTLSNAFGMTVDNTVTFTGDLGGFTGTINFTGDRSNATSRWRFGTSNTIVNLANASLVLNKGNLILPVLPNKNVGFADNISGTTLRIGALSGDGNLQGSAGNVGLNTFEIGNLNTNTTFSGFIGGGNGGTNIAVAKVGAGTLTLTGANNYAGTTTISAGTLVIGNSARNPILSSGAGADILGNGKLVFDYTGGTSPAASVLSILDAAFDESTPFSSGKLRASSLIAGGALGWSDLNAKVTIIQTLSGDADLTRTVDFADLLTLAKNYGNTGKNWADGDFNYDQKVDFTDLLALAKNYGQSLPAAEAAAFSPAFAADFALAQTLAPEPGVALAILATLGGGAMRRTRTIAGRGHGCDGRR